jgi:chromosome segregation ATPase
MTSTIQKAVTLYKEASYIVEHKNQQELIKFLQDNKGTYEIDTILDEFVVFKYNRNNVGINVIAYDGKLHNVFNAVELNTGIVQNLEV